MTSKLLSYLLAVAIIVTVVAAVDQSVAARVENLRDVVGAALEQQRLHSVDVGTDLDELAEHGPDQDLVSFEDVQDLGNVIRLRV